MIPAIGAIAAKFLTADSAPTLAQPNAAAPTTGASFDQMFGQVVNDAIGAVRSGEAAAIQGVDGSLSTFKVVEQVMSAQRTLQQAIAIRDKAVSAYQEITRMTI